MEIELFLAEGKLAKTKLAKTKLETGIAWRGYVEGVTEVRVGTTRFRVSDAPLGLSSDLIRGYECLVYDGNKMFHVSMSYNEVCLGFRVQEDGVGVFLNTSFSELFVSPPLVTVDITTLGKVLFEYHASVLKLVAGLVRAQPREYQQMIERCPAAARCIFPQ